MTSFIALLRVTFSIQRLFRTMFGIYLQQVSILISTRVYLTRRRENKRRGKKRRAEGEREEKNKVGGGGGGGEKEE